MNIKYLKIALVFFVMIAIASCGKSIIRPDWSNGVPDVESLFIGGTIRDSKSGEALPGVTVVLCAYEKMDLTRFYKPFYTDTTYSRPDGTYSFSYLKCMATRIYSIKAIDKSAVRDEHYKTGILDLYLEETSPCYNSTSKSYTISGNDLFLSK